MAEAIGRAVGEGVPVEDALAHAAAARDHAIGAEAHTAHKPLRRVVEILAPGRL